MTHLRNEFYAKEAEEFNDAASRREVEKSYTLAKAQATCRRTKTKNKTIPGLFSHFKQHFTHATPKVTPSILQQPRPQPPNPVNYDVEAPDRAELADIIRGAKSGKSSLDIPVDFLKIMIESDIFMNSLTEYYAKIWDNADVPAYLGESMIVAIWKNKGSKSDVNTWRGIMLSSILTKILSVVFIRRISDAYNKNIGQGQFGFRKNRGCADGVYCLKRPHQWSRKSQRELYVGMVDLSAAFDWVDRKFSWESVRHIVGDSILITIMEDMYDKTTAYMKENTEMRFKSTCGVRQGGTESPYVYNCLAQRCLDTFEARCRIDEIPDFKIPFKIPKNASNSGQLETGEFTPAYFGFADDLVINAWSRAELQKKLQILWDVCTEFGLYMNLTKTETLIFNWNLGKPIQIPQAPYPESICTLTNNKNEAINIKNSETFKYLGAYSQIDDSSIGKTEIDHRITSATCKFFELKNFFKNRKIKLATRIKFFNSLVRSRLTYLASGWTITKSELDKIQSATTSLLRHMVKGGLQNQEAQCYTKKDGSEGTFAKPVLKNEEILKITGIESITEYVHRQQDNWIGHCIRADDDTYIKRLTFADHFKGEAKKRGKLNTTYVQVLQRFECNDKKEKENKMIDHFVR